ncbi:hypothetical protein AB7849_09460 [Rhodanobacter sp. 115]|uniref:hypothetical protein n=1 Tax=Rhodanobacter sp. FW021-MT20 TaxID=1162282 RepID=UPI0034E601B1
MKVRRFYPRQVLLRLRDRHVDSLSRSERSALDFFIKRSRRYQLQVTIDEERVVRSTDVRYVMRITPEGGLQITSEPVKWPKATTMERVAAGRSIHLGKLGHSSKQAAVMFNPMLDADSDEIAERCIGLFSAGGWVQPRLTRPDVQAAAALVAAKLTES